MPPTIEQFHNDLARFRAKYAGVKFSDKTIDHDLECLIEAVDECQQGTGVYLFGRPSDEGAAWDAKAQYADWQNDNARIG